MIFTKNTKVSTTSQGYTGFTLAEILIVITIIGVVAAITIPNIINYFQDVQYKTAYKKAFANLEQAFQDAQSDYSLINCQNANRNPRPGDFDKNFLTLMSKFKVVKTCLTSNNSECWDATGEKYGLSFSTGHPGATAYAFIDSSGMAWSEFYDNASVIFLDTNGFRKPNQWGKDRFGFYIYDSNNIAETNMGVPVKISPFPDNMGQVCYNNKCGTVGDKDYQTYYGRSWLYK